MIKSLFALYFFSLLLPLSADPGKEEVASLKATALYGVNEESAKPERATALDNDLRALVTKQVKEAYQHYYLLGEKSEVVFRSYENWIKPLQNSEQVMLSYETKQVHDEGVTLSLKLWQGNQQILTADQLTMQYNEPLLITGPAWRGGKIMIALELQKR